ncbi:uncharacterized protein PAC_06557 [Phialocephala subalpina]|uniref:Uncharacterized protein n=1 Tax=Phialocephala subalpina TaxID=576137 RepID=A0A1L7WV77_9HELO|nr:uncharacterized protein PAC_06557 [Phialocephala subalpina]
MSGSLSTTPKREAARTEFSAECLEPKLNGHGYACPHFPKFKARESGFPSCLGFFRENDKDKIIYVELSKLCGKCCSEVVPDAKDYNVWINERPPRDVLGKLNGVVPKEHSIWDIPECSKGLYREFIQAGTPLRKRECMGPPRRESTPQGLFNLPTIIKMTQDAAAEEAWSSLKDSGKPFYIEQLHLVKRRTPWAEKTAMEDSWIARKHGNFILPSSKSTKKKASVPGSSSSSKSTPSLHATQLHTTSSLLPPNPNSLSTASRNGSMKDSNGDSSTKSSKKSTATSSFHAEDIQPIPVSSAQEPQKARKPKPPTARVLSTKQPNPVVASTHEPLPGNELQSRKLGTAQERGPIVASLDVPFVDSPVNMEIYGPVNDLTKTKTKGGAPEPGSKSRDKALPNVPFAKISSPPPIAKPPSRWPAIPSVVLSERYEIVSPIPLGSPENFTRSRPDAGTEATKALQTPPIFQQLLWTYEAHQNQGQGYHTGVSVPSFGDRYATPHEIPIGDVYAYQQRSPHFLGYGNRAVQDLEYGSGSISSVNNSNTNTLRGQRQPLTGQKSASVYQTWQSRGVTNTQNPAKPNQPLCAPRVDSQQPCRHQAVQVYGDPSKNFQRGYTSSTGNDDRAHVLENRNIQTHNTQTPVAQNGRVGSSSAGGSLPPTTDADQHPIQRGVPANLSVTRNPAEQNSSTHKPVSRANSVGNSAPDQSVHEADKNLKATKIPKVAISYTSEAASTQKQKTFKEPRQPKVAPPLAENTTPNLCHNATAPTSQKVKPTSKNPVAGQVKTVTPSQKARVGSKNDDNMPDNKSQRNSKSSNMIHDATQAHERKDRPKSPNSKPARSESHSKPLHTSTPYDKPKSTNDQQAVGHAGAKDKARKSKPAPSSDPHAEGKRNKTSPDKPKGSNEKRAASHTGAKHNPQRPKSTTSNSGHAKTPDDKPKHSKQHGGHTGAKDKAHKPKAAASNNHRAKAPHDNNTSHDRPNHSNEHRAAGHTAGGAKAHNSKAAASGNHHDQAPHGNTSHDNPNPDKEGRGSNQTNEPSRRNDDAPRSISPDNGPDSRDYRSDDDYPGNPEDYRQRNADDDMYGASGDKRASRSYGRDDGDFGADFGAGADPNEELSNNNPWSDGDDGTRNSDTDDDSNRDDPMDGDNGSENGGSENGELDPEGTPEDEDGQDEKNDESDNPEDGGEPSGQDTDADDDAQHEPNNDNGFPEDGLDPEENGENGSDQGTDGEDNGQDGMSDNDPAQENGDDPGADDSDNDNGNSGDETDSQDNGENGSDQGTGGEDNGQDGTNDGDSAQGDGFGDDPEAEGDDQNTLNESENNPSDSEGPGDDGDQASEEDPEAGEGSQNGSDDNGSNADDFEGAGGEDGEAGFSDDENEGYRGSEDGAGGGEDNEGGFSEGEGSGTNDQGTDDGRDNSDGENDEGDPSGGEDEGSDQSGGEGEGSDQGENDNDEGEGSDPGSDENAEGDENGTNDGGSDDGGSDGGGSDDGGSDDGGSDQGDDDENGGSDNTDAGQSDDEAGDGAQSDDDEGSGNEAGR